MSQDEFDVVIAEKIVEPIPAGSGLDNGLMRAGQGVEVIEHRAVDVFEALLFDDSAVLIDGGDI